MEKFCILILVALFLINSLGKAESVQLEELPLQTFDELFVDGWWDKDDAAEDLKTPAPTNFGQNVHHHQIDRQNTQIGQIKPNSTDQLGQIEPISTDQLGQIEPISTDQLGQIELNSTDQNVPLTESDHSNNAKNGEEQNEVSSTKNIAEDERKRKIINKFHAMKNEFKGKFSNKEWVQIEIKIAKHLKINRSKIYKWKKEFGLSQRNPKNERKNLVEKFDQRKAELKRAGFKNSYPTQINETVAKELGLHFKTIFKWKRELAQTTPKHLHSQSEQKELMKRYYEIKDKPPKINDADIAKMLKIGSRTLYNWKKQFKRQQFHPNSVDGHSVEENAAENVHKSNSESLE